MTAGRRTLPSRLVLLGHPVSRSLSPTFQNAALRAAGLPIRYAALDVQAEALPAVLEELRQEDAAGNVTVPHKRAVALACDRMTHVAERAGAVNTFWFEGGRLIGDNTDVGGFAAAVDELLGIPSGAPWPERIGLLGAGGAARAVLVAAADRGVACVELRARNRASAQALAAEFPGVRVGEGDFPDATALVINATSVGMTSDDLPLPPERLPRGAAVLDLVYRRGETPWVHACRAAGHAALDGLPMLLAQGALAFERFTGLAPDREAMRAAVEQG